MPTISGASRPWTRWWWMGSAVNEAEIARHLRLFQAAGFGGVEITPIYGAAGEEERYIPYLSPAWVHMLRYTVREARRLDLDVDMITGTGWPLGGPWVSTEDGAARALFESYTIVEGGQVAQPIRSTGEPRAVLHALMAFSEDGQTLDLIRHVDAQRRLSWSAPAGRWTVYALFRSGTGQQVKRAAPGGEGNVVDHFSARAIERYLAPFDQAFAALPAEERVRCFFNDSYEVYEANWTDELFTEFQLRRGYDLRRYLPALCGQDEPDIVSRVRSDYRQTMADLLLEAFVQPWTAWANRLGAQSRNQAHGSPGNLLDLYAAVDIPETETFGPDWVRLAGLAPMPGTPPQQGGRADILVGKLASSAAHVAGRQLCTSEAFTWLDEHGKVPLAHMKAELDVMFVMGINHVFFHGTPYSPADADWPGWMFYATTHVGPTNPFWRDLPALNAYISRCQSFLQAGRPDNDLLLYLPLFDLWATDHGAEHLLHFLSVHSERWLDDGLPAFARAARWLWDRGYSFDFVSDQLLEHAIQVSGRQLDARGGSYQALVIPGCRLMPAETLERILALAREGATVLFVGDLPTDVPGLGSLAERRRQLRTALAALGPLHRNQSGIAEVGVDKGRLLVGPDVEAMLNMVGIRRESVVDTGIEVIRRRDDAGHLYFLANLGRQRLDQWVSLPMEAASALIVDPATDRHGLARMRASNDHDTSVYLQLEPGETILLRTHFESIDSPDWQYLSPIGEPHALEGEWHVDFIAGGPALPEPCAVAHLRSWTEWPGDSEALRAFSGTARYTITFDLPRGDADAWEVELGSVCHSARVKLNGRDLGTLYARPFRVVLSDGLREGANQLEIEVTNLMANRLADLDRWKVPWRKFFFVNIEYQPFDASDWEPLPSGLLGPVQLVPLGRL
ncbi:MAG TPA: glycosyl hydrolase [Herpetosiphonaceae bacterium]|nr:glycosyl hydrolase [Herpetosiphonaceae bacterium]